MQIDFNNICSNFNNYKELIINLFIEYYGEEYRELIINRLEKTYYNFSSSPDCDYYYMQKNSKNMKEKEIILIKLRNKKYQLICDHIDKQLKKELLFFIHKKMGISINNKNNQNEFLSLFLNENFDECLIDCYCSKINELLCSNHLQQDVKNFIINNRQKAETIFNKYNINIENVDEKIIDEIIFFRKILRKKRLNYISLHSDFSCQIFNYFKDNYGFCLPDDILSLISFIKNPYSGTIKLENDKKKQIFFDFIRLPITYLYSKGTKGYDVSLIHELIHKIETNGCVTGISLNENGFEESILNEIRTQKLAIKLTQKLHNMNIFIYDDPNDFKIFGESDYEYFFPLIDEFIEKYESILSNCAINNDSFELINMFGSSFIDFYNKINEIFYDLTQYISNNGKFSISKDKQIDILIEEMGNHFKNKNIKIKK